MGNVLALDISSASTGHAVFKDGKMVKGSLGVIALSHKTHGERLHFFEKALRDLIRKYKPKKILIEDIWRGPNPRTMQVLAYYHGATRKVVFEAINQEPIVLQTTPVRRIIEAKYEVILAPSKKVKIAKNIKKSSKELTFDFIKKKYKLRGYVFKKHNDITDAIALCLANSLMDENHDGPVSNTRRKSRRKRS